MSYIILGLAGALFIFTLVYFRVNSKKLQEERQSIATGIDSEIVRTKEEAKEKYEQYLAELDAQLKTQREHANETIKQINEMVENAKKQREIYLSDQRGALDEQIGNERRLRFEALEKEVEAHKAANLKTMHDTKAEIDKSILSYIEAKEKEKETYNLEVEEIKELLEDFRKKREVINEQIRLENQMENEFDMHRIILSEESKEDIEFLLDIQRKMNNKDVINKLIWSEYLQKPFNQMLNNVFGSNIPKNVIYCIEHRNNHKKYIGKTSGEVSKRWTEHVKTSLGIGGVKKSFIHESLFKHWDEFAFSLLEKVEDGKLSEREKYYIDFFESDKYGYNLKAGG